MESCERCLKPLELCVCEAIPSLNSRIHILILQHPQEPDKDLGSAHLAHLALPNSTLKVGLSWPNLKAALGREVQPSRWAVLYLGSGVKQPTKEQLRPEDIAPSRRPVLQFVDKKGAPLAERPQIEGIVILDGTWSQAKALWWRNAWLLKLKRAILNSPRKSLYRELRKEPRRECLSTIESIAESLVALGEPQSTGDQLRDVFGKLLDKKRASRRSAKQAEPTKSSS